jgi:hypothetical protein
VRLILLRFCWIERRLLWRTLVLCSLVIAVAFSVVHIGAQLESTGRTAASDGFPNGWYRYIPLNEEASGPPAELKEAARASVLTTSSVFARGAENFEAETTRYWLGSEGHADSIFSPRTIVDGHRLSRAGQAVLTEPLAGLLGVSVGQTVSINQRDYVVVGQYVIPTAADALAARTAEAGPAPSEATLLLGPDAAQLLQRPIEQLRGTVERSRPGRQSGANEQDLLGVPASGLLLIFAAAVSILTVIVTVSFLSIRLAEDAAALRAAGFPESGASAAGAAVGLVIGGSTWLLSGLLAAGVVHASRSPVQSAANQHWVGHTLPAVPIVTLSVAVLAAFVGGFSALWAIARAQTRRGGVSRLHVPLVVQATGVLLGTFSAVTVWRSGLATPVLLLASAVAAVWLSVRLLGRLGSPRRLGLRLIGGLISLQNWRVMALMTLILSVLAVVAFGAGVIQRVDDDTNDDLLPLRTFSAAGPADDVALLESRIEPNAHAGQSARVTWRAARAAGGDPVRVIDDGSAECLQETGENALQQCAALGRMSVLLEVGFVADADYARLGSKLGLTTEQAAASAGLAANGLDASPAIAVFDAEFQHSLSIQPFEPAATAPGIGETVPGLIIRASDLPAYGLTPADDRAGLLVFDVDQRERLSALRGAASQSPSIISEYEPGRLPRYIESTRQLSVVLIPFVYIGLYLLGAALSSRSNIEILGTLERAGATRQRARRLSLLCHGLLSVCLTVILVLVPALITWWASRRLGTVLDALALPAAALTASAAAAAGLSARSLNRAMTKAPRH